MTRMIALILVLAAALLAILALGMGRRNAALVNASTPARPSAAPATQADAKLVNVVIAAKVLPAGEPLDATALDIVRLTALPPTGYSSPEALLGAVPALDIPAGSPILAGDLAQSVAAMLRPGERALAVPVDEFSGVANRIAPGDYVDVFLSLKSTRRDKAQASVDDVQTRLLLSRLRVLAYGSRALGTARPSEVATPETYLARPGSADSARSEKRSSAAAVSEPARTAVLAVPVELATRLLLGAQQGKLALALRHPGDRDAPDSDLFPAPAAALPARVGLADDARRQLSLPENQAYAGIDMPGLLGHEDKPKPTAVHRAAASSVEIIRGASRAGRPASP
ncbi:MAG: Flp pilus assembly protein CpaB [Dyella sp.]